MADAHPDPDPSDDRDAGSERHAATGAPRWVKVFGLAVAALVVLVLVVQLVAGGEHGPGRHAPSLHPEQPASAPAVALWRASPEAGPR